MATLDGFDQVVEQYHSALGEVVKGDPEPLKLLDSHREEVSLANPFFPPVSGWDKAAQNIERAALRYRDGEIVGFEPGTFSRRWTSLVRSSILKPCGSG